MRVSALERPLLLRKATKPYDVFKQMDTRLTLGQSYPGNNHITLVNNEPAGSAPAPLDRSKNFSDVLDKVMG